MDNAAKMDTAAVSRDIRLLLVDDYEPSRMVQSYFIENSNDDVKVVSFEKPPSIDEMLGYDGIILDQKLIGETGIAIAARLSSKNWKIPIMIMTALKPNDDSFQKAYEYVDHVAWKSDPELFGKMLKVFLRQIRRIRAATQ
jgi:CheY-like chemotaxis protein